jgi:sugar lactone lactonase YvrE
MIEKLKIEIRDKAARQIIPDDSEILQVATGFGFTEGPVWCGNYLLFSDIPMNRIIRLDLRWEGPEVTTFRSPSGNPNGSTLDNNHRLINCEHSGRRVTLTEIDGTVKVLAASYEGGRLNSPNDVVFRSDGSIYFTDPPFGLRNGTECKEQPCNGVYRIAPNGEITRLIDDFDRCNGLAFSPDESILYINDTFRKHIRAFDVDADGRLKNGRIFIEMQGEEPGAPDGMKVDQAGNVYCTGPGGFWIINPEGKCLARVFPPEFPSNMAWGDADWQTLYITARTSVYRTRFLVPGIPVGSGQRL